MDREVRGAHFTRSPPDRSSFSTYTPNTACRQTPLFLQFSIPGGTARARCKGSHIATDRPETGQDLWGERCSAVKGGTAHFVCSRPEDVREHPPGRRA